MQRILIIHYILIFGCCIVLNGNILANTDNKELEFHLDHEINHYFDKCFSKNNELENIDLTDKILKLATDARIFFKNKN